MGSVQRGRLGCVLMLWLTLTTASVAQNTPPELVSIIAGPYLQVPSAKSITVMWVTNRNTDAWVEYGVVGGPPVKAWASQDGLKDANSRIHKVVLDGLTPDTMYEYRVFSRDILEFGAYKVKFGETVSSTPQQFRTLPKERAEVSFVAFNDIHGRFEAFPKLLAAANRPADFVVFNGDMLDYLKDETQVLALMKAGSEAFAGSKPLVYVRGNHETRGSFARELSNYVASPNGRYYYSFECGPVHIIVLDTGEDKVDSHGAYSGLVDFDRYRSEQTEWLRAEVSSPAFRAAKYRIVLAHMPFPEATDSEEYHGMADANAKFGPLLKNAGVDLLISAHEHESAIVKPVKGKHSYAVVRGGGPKKPTLIHVAADAKRLKVEILLGDGTTAESYEVKARR